MKEQLCGQVISCKDKFGKQHYINVWYCNEPYVIFKDTVNLAKMFKTPEDAEVYFNECINKNKILCEEYDMDTFIIEEVTYKTYEYKKL